jgi:hypothetical protein
MILTKGQIIDLLFSGYDKKVITGVRKMMFRTPDFEFIHLVKNDLNWNLEIIRKNTYIVTT